MDKILIPILDYIKLVFVKSFSTILIFILPLILLVILMNYVSKFSNRYSKKIFGQKFHLLTFGWLGTLFHELGYAFFSILFMHKINEVKLFKVDLEAGKLGYIKTTYNEKNFYHRLGSFFIGIGPVLFGAVVIFSATYYLYNKNILDYSEVTSLRLDGFSYIKSFVITFLSSSKNILKFLMFNQNIVWWRVVVFIYLIFSIGTSASLSKSDIRGVFLGVQVIIILIFIINSLTAWKDKLLHPFFVVMANVFKEFYLLIFITILLNFIFFSCMYLFSLVKDGITLLIIKSHKDDDHQEA